MKKYVPAATERRILSTAARKPPYHTTNRVATKYVAKGTPVPTSGAKAIRTAVESGLCAAALSDLVVEKSLRANTLYRIDEDLAKRSFYVLRHKERHVSKAETALLAIMTTAKSSASHV